MDKRSNVR